MPLLNFKPQFVEPIRLGTKHHTIRADRKIPIKAGDLHYLYCGARTQNCFRILPEPQKCTRVLPISIQEELGGTRVAIDGAVLVYDEIVRLAQADGFAGFNEFFNFWVANHSQHDAHRKWVDFKGQIIHWR